jgi:dolichyl-phosphate-mannose-protein mannosyltransferase
MEVLRYLKQQAGRFLRWEYGPLVVLVAVILLLHFSIMMQPNQPLFDELHYVPDARLVMSGEETARPEHPPLSKLFIIGGIELFGDNPVGWRFFPIIFSLAGVVFFYLACRRLNLSRKLSFVATFLLGLENLSFVHGSIAMLDVYSVTFSLLAFWLYLRKNYIPAGIAIGLSGLAKMTGLLALAVIGLHWALDGGLLLIWRQLRLFWRLLRRQLRHRWRLMCRFLTVRIWRKLRFLPSMLAVPAVFLGLMPLMDYGVFHKWTNPIARVQKMMEISGSITYDWVEPGTGSRPWMWVLTPEVMPYWYSPHYTGMISPTIWVCIMPLVLYMTWRAIRGNTPVLFPLSWFICGYMLWIPLSLVTDRVTYLFYFYPTVGAIAIGLAIAMSPILNKAWGRGVIAVYLLLHVIAFVVISPVALCWSIPLGLLLYILVFWLTGLGEGLRFRRREPPEDEEPEEAQPPGDELLPQSVDIPPPQ